MPKSSDAKFTASPLAVYCPAALPWPTTANPTLSALRTPKLVLFGWPNSFRLLSSVCWIARAA